MTLLQVLGLGLFAAISWYVPLQAYARSVILKTKYAEGRWSPLLLSYFVWYIPVVFLLIGTMFSDPSLACSILAVVAILWAYIGHQMMLASRIY